MDNRVKIEFDNYVEMPEPYGFGISPLGDNRGRGVIPSQSEELAYALFECREALGDNYSVWHKARRMDAISRAAYRQARAAVEAMRPAAHAIWVSRLVRVHDYRTGRTITVPASEAAERARQPLPTYQHYGSPHYSGLESWFAANAKMVKLQPTAGERQSDQDLFDSQEGYADQLEWLRDYFPNLLSRILPHIEYLHWYGDSLRPSLDGDGAEGVAFLTREMKSSAPAFDAGHAVESYCHTYSAWANGEAVWFQTECRPDGAVEWEETDSCGGFLPDVNNGYGYMLTEAGIPAHLHGEAAQTIGTGDYYYWVSTT